MRTITSSQVLEYAYGLDLSKQGQLDRQDLALRLANAMNGITVDVKDDTKQNQLNLGQAFEGFIKADRFNLEHARFSKCNEEDLTYKNGSYEIKVSTSTYSLCTPLTKAIRVIFITKTGAYYFTKKQVSEWLELRKSNKYIRVKDGGICFKPTCDELGKPVKWLNDLLGF